MSTENLRQRVPPTSTTTLDPKSSEKKRSKEPTPHPAGEVKHGTLHQALRMLLFAVYFNGSCIASVYTVTNSALIGR